jgi:tRNA modification GTPase
MKTSPLNKKLRPKTATSANTDPAPNTTNDTICAISTPMGEGGIGIVRVSGPDAIAIADRVFRGSPAESLRATATHTLHYGHLLLASTGERLDEVLVSVMRAPRTYTREDTVEINAHGGPLLLHRILEALVEEGARMAEPGEFTQRAFLSGRIDLTQAEAVMDLIQAKTESSCRAALSRLEGALGKEIQEIRERLTNLLAFVEASIDFTEEDIQLLTPAQAAEGIQDNLARVLRLLDTAEEGRILREGLATVIVGRPNVGKSSLLNCLLRQDRAIVTPIAGTTRDLLEEYLNIKGIPLKIMDTAGLQPTTDPIEQEGMRRAQAAMSGADLLLVVVEASEGLQEMEEGLLRQNNKDGKRMILVINKIDLAPRADEAIRAKIDRSIPAVAISATQGLGLEGLKETIKAVALSGVNREAQAEAERPLVAQLRHKTALQAAKTHLEQALEALRSGMQEEILAFEIRGALDRLGEIIGATTTEDILDRIFQNFCIGK